MPSPKSQRQLLGQFVERSEKSIIPLQLTVSDTLKLQTVGLEPTVACQLITKPEAIPPTSVLCLRVTAPEDAVRKPPPGKLVPE